MCLGSYATVASHEQLALMHVRQRLAFDLLVTVLRFDRVKLLNSVPLFADACNIADKRSVNFINAY